MTSLKHTHEFAVCKSDLLTTFRSSPSANTFLSASSWSRMVFCSSGAFAPLTTATSFPPWDETNVLLKPQKTLFPGTNLFQEAARVSKRFV